MIEEYAIRLNNAYADMRGYIDGFYSVAKHYGVPLETASEYAKHMHSCLKRIEDLETMIREI